ncbi:HET-domain-containing protein, partial [Ophiobolus disseminans]
MYLLRLQNDGPFNLKEFIDGDIPHYAILSHTWDRSSDEVTFQDVHSDAGDWKAKKGYKKLIFLEQQARKDGLDYFWIDTCCINKESSAEHSEAINSMFRWYQRAQKCYVYLSDVYALSLENELDGMGPWKRAFQRSRWFTRIWTLQELLAPNTVEFFSADRVSLGLREILHKEINEITGIPTEALTGHRRPMFKFTVGQRVRWARNRKAKREEDVAYALLGIFDVNMPLIYGEGKRKALARLDRVIQ